MSSEDCDFSGERPGRNELLSVDEFSYSSDSEDTCEPSTSGYTDDPEYTEVEVKKLLKAPNIECITQMKNFKLYVWTKLFWRPLLFFIEAERLFKVFDTMLNKYKVTLSLLFVSFTLFLCF